MTKRSKTAKAAKSGPVVPAIAKTAKAIPATAILLVLGACAVGALALFLFDATEGQRRRQLIRDKALQAGQTISKGGRDVRQRLESVATRATKLVRSGRSDGMEAMHG